MVQWKLISEDAVQMPANCSHSSNLFGISMSDIY